MREEGRPGGGQLAVLGCCALAMVLHQAVRWGWTIDDAGICFAYARNLATGEGAVPWPGGERIEGYSDPTWVALLAVLYGLGLDGFQVAKPLAMGLGLPTLWLVWRLADRVLVASGHRGYGALAAPMALAVSAQFAIWSASGLENALWCLLLALAIHRTGEDIDGLAARRFPWASVAWLLLAWTRPEGLLYAVLGGGVYAVWVWRQGAGVRPVLGWASVVGVPLLLSEVVRLAYFAWPLPNTFYAKVASRGVAPLDWDSRGWSQLREWADRLWYGYFAPVYALAFSGADRRRAAIGVGAVAVLAASLLWPGTADLRALRLWPALPEPPEALVLARLLAIAAAGVLLPLLALGREGGARRAEPTLLLCGWSVTAGLAFSVAVNGDWMGAYRFVSLVSPCLAVLFAVGLTVVVDAVQERLGGGAWGGVAWTAFAFGTGLLLPPNASQTRDHRAWNRNETTASVKQRVDHTEAVRRRTFWEGPVVNLEVDQGAHLWWAPDRVEVDMAMLVDIPMSRHWYQQTRFVREYVFEEQRPTFAHVGGWWAKHTGLREYPEWSRTFFELPPYVDLRFDAPFRNVFARRELVLAPRWEGPQERTAFDWDLVLHGVVQPAPWVPGRSGYLELPFSVTAARPEGSDVAVTAFLAREGRVVASFDLPMGYGLLPMHEWAPGEVFRGRHAVPVPAGLAPGRYDLGVWVRGPRGYTVPVDPAGLPEGARTEPALLAAGEVRFPERIEVVDEGTLEQRIEAQRERVRAGAAAGRCEAAEDELVRLVRHRPDDEGWQAVEREAGGRGIADCFARRAEGEPPDVAAKWLARAHRWDHRSPELARVGGPVAEALLDEARLARASGDWEAAYAAFSAVLGFEPWRAWARRYAEEARDHRLGLVGDRRIGIGGYDDLQESEEP